MRSNDYAATKTVRPYRNPRFRSGWLSRTLVLFLTLGSLASLLGTIGASAAPRYGWGAATAGECGGDRYVSAQRDDGTTFSNSTQCARYVAQGGAIYAPALAFTEPLPGFNHAHALVEGSGFHPNSALTLVMTFPSGAFSNPTLMTDANGTFSSTVAVYFLPCGTVVPVTATDASGAHASGSFTIVGCS